MTSAAPSNHSEGPLSQFTVLVAFESSAKHRSHFEQSGAHLITWPELKIEAPADYSALDEAIENVYGYDWLIFIKSHSAAFFLDRFQRGHEISELDSLRVCAPGESTVELLENSSVHVDVIPEQLKAEAVVAALANYAGGTSALGGLNFLLPQATIGRNYLKDDLVDAGARADVVAAYRTTANGDSSLTRLQTLILSGGVDCVMFESAADVNNLALLFDVNDLSRLLREVAVACLDDGACEAAVKLGVRDVIKAENASFQALMRAIASHSPR
jgi:uroporphyrinogen III methyltransferase/synthase